MATPANGRAIETVITPVLIVIRPGLSSTVNGDVGIPSGSFGRFSNLYRAGLPPEYRNAA